MTRRALDPASRVTLAELLRMAWLLGLCGSAAWIAGFIPNEEAMGRFGLLFSIGGIQSMLVAARRRELPGRGPLNHWDACLALNATALLFSAAQQLRT